MRKVKESQDDAEEKYLIRVPAWRTAGGEYGRAGMPGNFNADDRFAYLVLNTLRPCRDDTCWVDDIAQLMPAVRQRYPAVSINPSVCAALRSKKTR